MRSMRFSLPANIAAVFLMTSSLHAGDHNGPGSSVPEAASVARAVQEFMEAVATDVTAQCPLVGATANDSTKLTNRVRRHSTQSSESLI